MPVAISLTSDLEKHLKWVSKNKGNHFPNRNGPYFAHYTSIKQRLADKYYAVTGAALAQEGDRYTKHDIGHVDDVIAAASRMLGFGHKVHNPAYKNLAPYEVFVLLLAILLHDAGNAYRRQGHEKMAAEILREEAASAGLGALEQRIISSIAQAHGGETIDGNKDTITASINDPEPNIGGIKVYARRLAALVRLADELSENPTRADLVALELSNTPPMSLLANLYCKAINPWIDFEGKSVHLTFDVDVKLLPQVFKIPKGGGQTEDILFIDYIAQRLEKCERERRYCNRFLAGFASFDRIRAKLVISDQDRQLDTVPVDLEEMGYPSLSKSIKELQPSFDACILRDKYCLAAE